MLRSSPVVSGLVLAVAIGLAAGLGVVVFERLLEGFQWLFFDRGGMVLGFLGSFYVVALPALGGLLVGLLIHFTFHEARGHGIPEVMEAVALRGGRIRSPVALVRAVAASLCIGSGGSAGAIEPVVHIGSAAGSGITQWFRPSEDRLRTMVLSGAAGGISAVFNAPIGGVFFALEVIQRRFVIRNPGFIIISSVTADFVSHQFLGRQPAFTIPVYGLTSYWEIVPYALLGVAAALAAIIFVRFFYKVADLFDAIPIPPYLKPAVGGALVGLLGWYSFDLFGSGLGQAYGVGGAIAAHGGIDKALAGELALYSLLVLAALKMVATSITLGSGGSGGVFAPSLFIGSTLGGAFGSVISRFFPGVAASGAYALVGMGAFFAGVANAPITSVIMLFEMTRNYNLILPLMTAVTISTFIARKECIYTQKLVRRGVDINLVEQEDVMKRIRVGEVMTPDFPTVRAKMPLAELIEELHRRDLHGFPVVDEADLLYGIVALEDVEAAMGRNNPNLTAGDIATRSPVVAYPDQSVYDALARFRGRDVGRIPVVSRNDPRRLVGVLSRHDITRAYHKAISAEGRGLS